jgi:hypothetical protein
MDDVVNKFIKKNEAENNIIFEYLDLKTNNL